MSILCSHCGSEVVLSASFCHQCGNRLKSSVPDPSATTATRSATASSTTQKVTKEVKGMGLFLLGHGLHLTVSYGPPVLVVYLLDRAGLLSGGTLGLLVPMAILWIFVMWFLTRKWSEWGS